jgi:hypothetical protein
MASVLSSVSWALSPSASVSGHASFHRAHVSSVAGDSRVGVDQEFSQTVLRD